MSLLQLRIYNGLLYAIVNSNTHDNILGSAVVVATSIFGIVNLDFFRDVFPSICLHPRLHILYVVSLDYIIAFFLIFLTYLLVTMYDRNYSIVVLAWKPFRWCSKRFIHHFNVKASLIETFATFILLSNVKVLGVCCDILGHSIVYDVNGTPLKPTFLYYDANIERLSREHIPFVYVVLALMTGILFVFVPFLILVVYPCRCFQKCLNRLGWRCQALHVFMDAFQGSYKTEPYISLHTTFSCGFWCSW